MVFSCSASLYSLCTLLSSFFSETKGKTAEKITAECFTTKLKNTCKNSGTFEEKKELNKSHFISLAPSHSIIANLRSWNFSKGDGKSHGILTGQKCTNPVHASP